MSKPIYIYVTPFFPEPGRHYGSYGYDFVEAVKRNSAFDVRVFVGGCGSDYNFEGCRVYRFPIKSLPSGLFPYLYAKRNENSFIDAVARAGIKLEDVAICHGNTATYAIYSLAVKHHNPQCLSILHHHSLDGFGLRLGKFRHFWLHRVINFFITRRLFEKIDCHVFISEASKRSTLRFPDTSWSYYKDYRRMGRGLELFRPARIRESIILWNGVDMRKFNQAFPRNMSVEGHGFCVGCVGNFIEVKDHMSLVKAIEQLKRVIPGLRLELLGTSGVGNFYVEVRKYIEKKGLDDIVRILDNVSHEAMPEYYRKLDLMVLPSYFEGFGCVYLESWACGTPFIACSGAGIEDVLSDEERRKWLCEPRNPTDLADKIYSYYKSRYCQILNTDVSIDALVLAFLRKIRICHAQS